MSDTALSQAELIVRTIAQTAVDNEKYFCELDAVVGDGDFGYSLARGFEIVLSDWDAMEYSDPAGLLKKTAIMLTKRIGGTSGPIWGTAFLRAGGSLNDTPEPTGEQVIAALRAAIEGIKQRGNADLGDKTLLDALVPGGRRARGRAVGGGGHGARARSGQGARERGGDEGHAREARAGVLHRRAQPRLGRRGRGRGRRDVRGREQGLAGVGAGDGLTPERHHERRRTGEEVRQRPAAVRAGDAEGHRARQPRQAQVRPRVQPDHAHRRAARRQGVDRPGLRLRSRAGARHGRRPGHARRRLSGRRVRGAAVGLRLRDDEADGEPEGRPAHHQQLHRRPHGLRDGPRARRGRGHQDRHDRRRRRRRGEGLDLHRRPPRRGRQLLRHQGGRRRRRRTAPRSRSSSSSATASTPSPARWAWR